MVPVINRAGVRDGLWGGQEGPQAWDKATPVAPSRPGVWSGPPGSWAARRACTGPFEGPGGPPPPPGTNALPAFTSVALADWLSKLVHLYSPEGVTDLSPQPWPHEGWWGVCVPLGISPVGGCVRLPPKKVPKNPSLWQDFPLTK